ncbi:MAG: hypothetical protein EA406_08280 [Rhodospirillales bacterium]|nr:MAG: hypothetical protein EA406_08280 [Rhodospirillales bacterium]
MTSEDAALLQKSVDRRIAWVVGVLAAITLLAGLSAMNYDARAAATQGDDPMVLGYGIAEAGR